MAIVSGRWALGAGGLLVAAVVVLSCGRGSGWAQPLYGYEDKLGMLHTSTTKRNKHYKPLGTGKVDHDTLMRALRAQDALGGPPPSRLTGAVLPADMGNLSEVGARIMQAAKPFLGAPYHLGGDTQAGIDCSGLTRAVYARFGCTLPRQSKLQAACGTPVAQDQLQAGDLVFFSTDRPQGINHVALYLGQGMILHSTSRRGGVVVERLPGTRYQDWYVTARRLPRTGKPLAAAGTTLTAGSPNGSGGSAN